MDLDEETRKLKAMLFVAVVFIASCFYSCNELKYARGGKRVEGRIDDVTESVDRHGETRRQLHYHYHNDAGELRQGFDTVGDDFVRPASGKLEVEYLPGASRLAGHRNVAALVVFFLSLAAMLVGGVMFWQYVRRETKASSSASSRRGNTRNRPAV